MPAGPVFEAACLIGHLDRGKTAVAAKAIEHTHQEYTQCERLEVPFFTLTAP